MKINQVAELAGVSVRTLHYYDQIGLLRPCQITQAGYRIYGEHELEALQQILFFREVGFELAQIKDILQNPDFDRAQALACHRELLLKKRNRLEGLIALVDNTLIGERKMSFKEFDMTEIEQAKEKYGEEARQKWGNTAAYAQSVEKTNSYGKEEWKEAAGGMDNIFAGFAAIRRQSPQGREAQQQVRKLQQFITQSFYICTDEILAGLGEMYIGDARFAENIDKNGAGTAEFAAKAIAFYTESKNK